MQLQNGTDVKIWVVVTETTSGNTIDVAIPAGVTIKLPTSASVYGVQDNWAQGEAYIYVSEADPVYGVVREFSPYHDFGYGMAYGLPCAILLLSIWAVLRGLRPSLDNN